ncbi:MAG: Maf family protein [Novosphingobium sp.]|nr:Maf family protein [Novosphingobium sp.]
MIILASTSAPRRAMRDAACAAYQAVPANLDERALEQGLGPVAPRQVAIALARAKALAVSRLQPGKLVLGSDSLVEVDGRRFDKPADREEAANHLRFFSGKPMRLHSAAALARNDEILFSHAALATLAVRELSEEFIRSYLDEEWPEVGKCVGVFRIEGRGVNLFERMDGDQFTVQGMPLLEVLSALRRLGELPR